MPPEYSIYTQHTPFGACATGCLNSLESYISHGWSVNSALPDGTRGLQLATFYRWPHIIEKLIQSGADINAQQANGLTALHLAASKGFIDILTILLDTGRVNLDVTDDYGMTPLHYAAAENKVKSISMLRQHGAQPDLLQIDGLTPLSCAAVRGQRAAVQECVQHGVAVDSKDTQGRTALHWAVNCGFEEIATILVKAGADKFSTDDAGLMPLQLAGKYSPHWLHVFSESRLDRYPRLPRVNLS